MVAVFPVIRHGGVAEDEPNQIGEASLRTDIVRKDEDATLTGLNADHRISRLAVVPAFVKAMTLRAVEDDHTQTRVQIFALLTRGQVWQKRRELMGSSDMEQRLRHLGTRCRTQAIAPH